MINEEGVLRSEFKAAEVKIHEEKIDLFIIIIFNTVIIMLNIINIEIRLMNYIY